METMNWKDLQYRKPRAINKKVKQNKGSQAVHVKCPFVRTTFSASDWVDYQQWTKRKKTTGK